MESSPYNTGGVMHFSDQIPDAITNQPSTLSILAFNGEHVAHEKVPESNRWSSGITFKSTPRSKAARRYSVLADDQSSVSDYRRPPLLRNVLWPMMAIVLPISLLTGVLIGLVCGYRVKTEQNLFPPPGSADESPSSTYILVNYSATRLVFVASWLSTMAPILASFVMVLWSLPIAQTMRVASVELNAGHLPTPYQLSLIVGVTLASMQRLRRYFEYALSKSRPSIPPVLHKAAMMLSLCVFLACGVFVGDTALHYYTETVPFSSYSMHVSAMHDFSHGASDSCLTWNRTDWLCLPCSATLWTDNAEEKKVVAEEDEVFLLQNNKSRTSEIRMVQDPAVENADLAILLPQAQTIPPDIDYHGTTIGVSTQCSLITKDCKMRRMGDGDYDTQFNCSNSFYGVLGLPPVLSDSGTAPNQTADPNVPILNWKPFLSLQYGYYADKQLTQSYATGAFSPTTGDFDPGQCVPDNELINPVYVGVAGRFDASASSQSLLNEPGIMESQDQTYADFVLSCSYTTFEVDYTWFNGTIQNISSTKSPNGTLAEMYHGSQMHASITGGAHDLMLNVVQAVQQANSPGFLREWGSLYSLKVLSSIGAYTAARPSVQEQVRTTMLVAKVPTIALGAIMACSLAYVVLGFALGFAAYKCSSTNVQDLAARLSLAGLAAAAFEERDGTGKHERIIKDPDFEFSRKEDGTRRVAVEGVAQTGYILSPVCSPEVTPIHSRPATSGETIC